MATLAVVPILVNAAPILPAILAGAAGMLALLFKPRELARACRRRPGVALGVVGGLVVIGFGMWWLAGGEPAKAARPLAGARAGAFGAGVPQRDWAEFALELIRREQLAAAGIDTGPGPATKPAAPTAARPLALGRDYSRCGFDGTAAAPLDLVPLWHHREDGLVFLSSPLVANGRVYVGSYLPDVAGQFGAVWCLDARTGKPIWQTAQANDEDLKPFFSSPAITADGKLIVIGQGLHVDKDCGLLCLDAETGRVRWAVKTPLHLESSPAIRGDVVVVGAGSIEGPDHKPTTDPGFVLAVRVSDGKELWRHPVNDPESSPAIGDDGTVYIGSGFNGNAVVALRSAPDDELKQKGLTREVWRTPAPYPVTGAVTLAGDLVIVGGGNGDYVYANPNPAGVVLALERATGAVRWQTPMPDAVLGAIAHRDGVLVCPVRNGEVVALSAADGKPRWRQRVSGEAPVLAGPAFTGTHVYAVSRDGYLAVLDAMDGAVLQKLSVNAEGKPGADGLSLSSPTIAGGMLFVGSETGGVRCLAGKRRAGGGSVLGLRWNHEGTKNTKEARRGDEMGGVGPRSHPGTASHLQKCHPERSEGPLVHHDGGSAAMSFRRGVSAPHLRLGSLLGHTYSAPNRPAPYTTSAMHERFFPALRMTRGADDPSTHGDTLASDPPRPPSRFLRAPSRLRDPVSAPATSDRAAARGGGRA